MKCSFLGHGLWFAAVLTAYFVGSTRSTNRSTNIDPEYPESKSEVSSILENRTINRADGTVSESDHQRDFSVHSNRRPLSETDIEVLGRRVRDELHPTGGRLAFARLLEGLTVENAELIRVQISHLDEKSAGFREFHYAWGEVGGKEAVMHCATAPIRQRSV